MRAFLRDKLGTSAIEFALVVPVFVALTVGVFNLCAMVWINSVLQYATDDAARCRGVDALVSPPGATPKVFSNDCVDVATTAAHAEARFHFPSLSPTFAIASTACGYRVTGTATYQLQAVLASLPVRMSAQSCFPVQTQ